MNSPSRSVRAIIASAALLAGFSASAQLGIQPVAQPLTQAATGAEGTPQGWYPAPPGFPPTAPPSAFSAPPPAPTPAYPPLAAPQAASTPQDAAFLAEAVPTAAAGSAVAGPDSPASARPETPDGDTPGIERGDSAECMRCHWMETMAYRDKDTRRIVNLSVDRDAYEHSVHHELACRDCHDRAYKHYPHRTSSADEGLTCVGCHEERQNDPSVQPPKLDGFDIQYQHSVHALEAEQEGGEAFSCFSCHNPHEFRPVADDTPVPEVVAANNALCLDCHTELNSPVPKGHDWLPRPQQHWSAVRCLDCHTPLEGRHLYAPSHQLLSAAESNQNCVECHSQGGELLAQLYVHRAEEEREQEGLLAHAIYNDAYIIGMSRSPLIDRIGLAIVGIMVLGVAAHGLGRYLTRKGKSQSGANRRGAQ